jgi:hypothetical protein
MIMLYEFERFRANHTTPVPTMSVADRARRPINRIVRRFSVVLSAWLDFGAERPVPLVPIAGL